MSDSLNPCRFCGSPGVEVENVFNVTIHVRCPACQVQGPTFAIRTKHRGLYARDAAIKAWNEGWVVDTGEDQYL